MRYLKPNKLHCFSPPVMIATFLIELTLAVYTVWRYGLNAVTKVVVAILVCLAAFQLAEFNVCETAWGIDSASWARIGYVAITLLPPLGIHLVARIAGDKRKWPYRTAYTLATLFSAYFLLATNGIAAGACLGNYVIFEQGHDTAWLYGWYYYGLLVLAIVYAVWLARAAKPHVRRALHALVVGYALFMVPTTLVNIVDPSTVSGIPSIMCGFAVTLALVLVFAVVPHLYSKGSARGKK